MYNLFFATSLVHSSLKYNYIYNIIEGIFFFFFFEKFTFGILYFISLRDFTVNPLLPCHLAYLLPFLPPPALLHPHASSSFSLLSLSLQSLLSLQLPFS